MLFQSLFNSLPGVASQGILWSVMALGVYITYKIMDIADLTVDGSFATGGAVCVVLIRSGVSPEFAVLFAIVVGGLAGFITGFLFTRCGIPAILSGILTQLALYSINLRILGGVSNLPVSVDKYRLLISQRSVNFGFFSTPLPLLIILVLMLIGILYWFFGTEMGCAMRATGSNAAMARAQGINTKRHILLSLVCSNALVALSGAMLSQYQGFADVNMGRGAIVIGLASVIIGEVLTKKYFKNFALKLTSVVIGSIVYYLVLQVTLMVGLNTNDLKVVSALIVAVFLAFPYCRNNIRERIRCLKSEK